MGLGQSNDSQTDIDDFELCGKWDDYVQEQTSLVRSAMNTDIPDVIIETIVEYASFLVPGRAIFIGTVQLSGGPIGGLASPPRSIECILRLEKNMTISKDESVYYDSDGPNSAKDQFRIISGRWSQNGKIEFGKTNVRSKEEVPSWLFSGSCRNADEFSVWDVNVAPPKQDHQRNVSSNGPVISFEGRLTLQKSSEA